MDKSDERVDIEELHKVVDNWPLIGRSHQPYRTKLHNALDELERLRELEDNLPIPYTINIHNHYTKE